MNKNLFCYLIALYFIPLVIGSCSYSDLVDDDTMDTNCPREHIPIGRVCYVTCKEKNAGAPDYYGVKCEAYQRLLFHRHPNEMIGRRYTKDYLNCKTIRSCDNDLIFDSSTMITNCPRNFEHNRICYIGCNITDRYNFREVKVTCKDSEWKDSENRSVTKLTVCSENQAPSSLCSCINDPTNNIQRKLSHEGDVCVETCTNSYMGFKPQIMHKKCNDHFIPGDSGNHDGKKQTLTCPRNQNTQVVPVNESNACNCVTTDVRDDSSSSPGKTENGDVTCVKTCKYSYVNHQKMSINVYCGARDYGDPIIQKSDIDCPIRQNMSNPKTHEASCFCGDPGDVEKLIENRISTIDGITICLRYCKFTDSDGNRQKSQFDCDGSTQGSNIDLICPTENGQPSTT